MGRTLAAHLSLITAKAERGAFEINWSLQSSAFNNATENFLSFRTVLTGADFEVELNFHEFIVLRATIPTCLVSEDFQCAGCLVLSRSAWRCLSRSLFSLVPAGKRVWKFSSQPNRLAYPTLLPNSFPPFFIFLAHPLCTGNMHSHWTKKVSEAASLPLGESAFCRPARFEWVMRSIAHLSCSHQEGAQGLSAHPLGFRGSTTTLHKSAC